MKYRLIATLPLYLALYALSLTAAFLLRFDLEIDADVTHRLLDSLPLALCAKGVMFIATREWRRRHRYTTMNDIVSIVATAAVSDRDRLAADDSLHESVAGGGPRGLGKLPIWGCQTDQTTNARFWDRFQVDRDPASPAVSEIRIQSRGSGRFIGSRRQIVDWGCSRRHIASRGRPDRATL